jgi:hypothetical protein
MRLPLARRIAAAALLFAWSAAMVEEVAAREVSAGPPAKGIVARKLPLPGSGALRREPIASDAAPAPSPVPVSGDRQDLTQPAYLRAFSSGRPHGHRDPPL